MRALSYVRPWNREQYLGFGQHAFPGGNIEHCGDFLGLGGFDLQERYYERLKEGMKIPLDMAALNNEVMEDVRIRCRLLRRLQIPRARQHILAMYRAICEVLDAHQPDAVFGVCVDSFPTDLLRIACNERGLRYLGLVYAIVNGYYRVTERGEHMAMRNPSEEEVLKAYDKLVTKSETPNFMKAMLGSSSTFERQAKEALRRIGRRLYFQNKRLLQRDPYCYHYWLNCGEPLLLNPFPSSWLQGSPGWLDQLKAEPDRAVYIPLQVVPEATLDYWVPNPALLDYENLMLEVIRQLTAANIPVFVKEHPTAVGFRQAGFYRQLAKIAGVNSVPISASSHGLIAECAATLIWTGTAGLEAGIRGKRVFHLGEPYYAYGPAYTAIPRVTDAGAIVTATLAQPALVQNKDDILAQVRHLLSSSLPGNLEYPKRVGGQRWVYDKAQVPLIGQSLGAAYQAGCASV